MKTIQEILSSYECDKHNDIEHSYGEFYADLFNKFDRNSVINILELGVQRGGSLLAWKEYFPNANVIGIDISDSRLDKYKQDSVKFIRGDLRLAIDQVKDMKFDIIIDDADHFDGTNAWVVANYYKLLKPVGIIVVEDIQLLERYWRTIEMSLPQGAVMGSCDLRDIKGRPDDFIITVTTPEGVYLHA